MMQRSLFDEIPGNEKVKTYLMRLVAKGTIPQSLLFSGPQGACKEQFAEAFAKLAIGTDRATHPDIRLYRPEGKIGMHSIQSMREFTEEVYMAPYSAARKVFILHDAHRMLPTSANALLKTFEEPALDSVIILITHAPEMLLPTVLSRCQRVRFFPVETAAVNTMDHPQREWLLNLLSGGHLKSYPVVAQAVKDLSDEIEGRLKEEHAELQAEWAEAFSDKPSAQQRESIEKEVEGILAMKKQEEARTLFDILLSWYRDMHLIHVGGNEDLLINSDQRAQLKQAVQRGELRPYEQIEKAVSDAILSLERSTTLPICFENLFLKLS